MDLEKSVKSLRLEVKLNAIFIILICLLGVFVAKDFYTKLDQLSVKIGEVVAKTK